MNINRTVFFFKQSERSCVMVVQYQKTQATGQFSRSSPERRTAEAMLSPSLDDAWHASTAKRVHLSPYTSFESLINADICSNLNYHITTNSPLSNLT